jgi:Bacterial archaeo-eukaryotic release factor family 7
MKFLSKAELKSLIEVTQGPCISIFMPAEKLGQYTRQNPIRFKNLINQAEENLSAREEILSSEINNWLQPAISLLDDNNFWQHQSNGLALFIAPNIFQYYRLPHKCEELVVVSDRFHFKPLLPVMTEDGQFYLLTLAQNQIRLFSGDRYGLTEIELPVELPSNMALALKYDEPASQRYFHGGSPAASFHGQGVVKSEHKENIGRYLQKIDNGLQTILHDEQAPLVLAGVDFLSATYRNLNSYHHLLPESINGNTEHSSLEELHQQAWEIVQPYFQQDQQKAKNDYHQLVGTGQASGELEKIVLAAYNGQVDTLYVALGLQCWGKFNSQTNLVEIHSQPEKDDVDLLDLAAAYTFLQNGKVYALEPEQIPENAPAAAIFRYPLFDGQFPTEKVEGINSHK